MSLFYIEEKKKSLGMMNLKQDKEKAKVTFSYFYACRHQGIEKHKISSVIFEGKGTVSNCFITVWDPYRYNDLTLSHLELLFGYLQY